MSEEKSKMDQVTIIDAAEEIVKQPEITLEDISGLSTKEREMALKSGLVKEKKEGENKDSKKEEKAEDKKEATDAEKKSFEDMEKNEDKLGEFTKREQALYFKWKSDKKERQKAQAERDLVTIKEKTLREELAKSREAGELTHTKLKKINDLLTGDPDDITIEAIQDILQEQVSKKEEEKEEEKPLTKKDLLDIEKAKEEKQKQIAETSKQFVKRMTDLEEYGKTKFENYDEIIDCANEVINGKIEIDDVVDHKEIAQKFIKLIEDPDVDEEQVAAYVLRIAKKNPKFGKKTEESKTPEKGKETKKITDGDIDKIVKNAGKSSTSTSVSGGGSGRRVVNVNDISLEDASKLSLDEYMKLPKETRERLKKELS